LLPPNKSPREKSVSWYNNSNGSPCIQQPPDGRAVHTNQCHTPTNHHATPPFQGTHRDKAHTALAGKATRQSLPRPAGRLMLTPWGHTGITLNVTGAPTTTAGLIQGWDTSALPPHSTTQVTPPHSNQSIRVLKQTPTGWQPLQQCQPSQTKLLAQETSAGRSCFSSATTVASGLLPAAAGADALPLHCPSTAAATHEGCCTLVAAVAATQLLNLRLHQKQQHAVPQHREAGLVSMHCAGLPPKPAHQPPPPIRDLCCWHAARANIPLSTRHQTLCSRASKANPQANQSTAFTHLLVQEGARVDARGAGPRLWQLTEPLDCRESGRLVALAQAVQDDAIAGL
jgi:hypothetical protein